MNKRKVSPPNEIHAKFQLFRYKPNSVLEQTLLTSYLNLRGLNLHQIFSTLNYIFHFSNVVHTGVFRPDNGKQTDREVSHSKIGLQLQRDRQRPRGSENVGATTWWQFILVAMGKAGGWLPPTGRFTYERGRWD